MSDCNVSLSVMLDEGEQLKFTFSRTVTTHMLSLYLADGQRLHLSCPAPDEDDDRKTYLERLYDALSEVKSDMDGDAYDDHIAQLDRKRAWPMAENE